MALELIVAYGFALSVPLWLAVEELAHRSARTVDSPVGVVVEQRREPVPALQRQVA